MDISNLWFAFRRPCSTPARRHKPRIGPRLPRTVRAAVRCSAFGQHHSENLLRCTPTPTPTTTSNSEALAAEHVRIIREPGHRRADATRILGNPDERPRRSIHPNQELPTGRRWQEQQDLPTTAKAVADAILVRFEPWMQDWPLEVADSDRIEEFLGSYMRGGAVGKAAF